ncbi:MAG: DUF308 domain-containing protein [Clostridiales bacterium]|nr:DUF308 domain-containing protein [Clostridiales bacterium]
MKNLKENLSNLIMSLCELVIGILLLMDPVGYTTGVITVVGAVLVVLGIISAVSHFRLPPEEAMRGHQLTVGLIELAVGLFCVFCSDWFIDTFPVLTLLYGVVLLVTGFVKVQWAIDLARMRRRQWFIALIGAALSFLGAAIIFTHPLTATSFLWVYTAITLIAEAVLDIVTVFFRGGRAPAEEVVEEVVEDAAEEPAEEAAAEPADKSDSED